MTHLYTTATVYYHATIDLTSCPLIDYCCAVGIMILCLCLDLSNMKDASIFILPWDFDTMALYSKPSGTTTPLAKKGKRKNRGYWCGAKGRISRIENIRVWYQTWSKEPTPKS